MNPPVAPSRSHTQSATWFTLVGAAAAAVHYVVAVGLESGLHVLPAWANVSGFLCAFPVSYFGHRHFSFAVHGLAHNSALPKFLLVACCGFAANQWLLLTLLHVLAVPFWLILGFVMVVVAVATYILSRFWAFDSK